MPFQTPRAARHWHARIFKRCVTWILSQSGWQSLPPPFVSLEEYRTARKISVISTVDMTLEQRDESIPRLCFTRSIPVGLVLIMMGCIVYLPTPRTLRTQRATPPSVVCKLIIAQLKLSHPVWPVPHKALRSRSSPAPIFLLLSSYVWLSVLQLLHLVLEHKAWLVCNTDSGATGDIEEGQTCIGLSIWCAYAHFVVS